MAFSDHKFSELPEVAPCPYMPGAYSEDIYKLVAYCDCHSTRFVSHVLGWEIQVIIDAPCAGDRVSHQLSRQARHGGVGGIIVCEHCGNCAEVPRAWQEMRVGDSMPDDMRRMLEEHRSLGLDEDADVRGKRCSLGAAIKGVRGFLASDVDRRSRRWGNDLVMREMREMLARVVEAYDHDRALKIAASRQRARGQVLPTEDPSEHLPQ